LGVLLFLLIAKLFYWGDWLLWNLSILIFTKFLGVPVWMGYAGGNVGQFRLAGKGIGQRYSKVFAPIIDPAGGVDAGQFFGM